MLRHFRKTTLFCIMNIIIYPLPLCTPPQTNVASFLNPQVFLQLQTILIEEGGGGGKQNFMMNETVDKSARFRQACLLLLR